MAIIDVVSYHGGPEVFAYKYPNDELSAKSQVIVNESQEAVFYKGGQALDVLSSGRHTLETANIPILRGLVGIRFGGQSPFKAEIYFVNKATSLDIKWGTASPIQIQDPRYGVFLPVRAFGQFGVKITDAKKFLVSLVGTMQSFDKTSLAQYFKGMYLTVAKDAISSYLVEKKISVLEINAYLMELSEFLKNQMVPELAKYGIGLVNFFVNDISVPENDSAVIKMKEALAKKAEMNIVGYDYQQERSFDTLEGAAKNPGGQSGMMGAGIGLGMGASMGGVFGGAMGQIGATLNTKPTVKCPACGKEVESGRRFCGECGFEMAKAGKIPCPQCGTAVAEASKFCPECGAPMQKNCPKCGVKIQGSHKFCPECGEKL